MYLSLWRVRLTPYGRMFLPSPSSGPSPASDAPGFLRQPDGTRRRADVPTSVQPPRRLAAVLPGQKHPQRGRDMNRLLLRSQVRVVVPVAQVLLWAAARLQKSFLQAQAAHFQAALCAPPAAISPRN